MLAEQSDEWLVTRRYMSQDLVRRVSNNEQDENTKLINQAAT